MIIDNRHLQRYLRYRNVVKGDSSCTTLLEPVQDNLQLFLSSRFCG